MGMSEPRARRAKSLYGRLSVPAAQCPIWVSGASYFAPGGPATEAHDVRHHGRVVTSPWDPNPAFPPTSKAGGRWPPVRPIPTHQFWRVLRQAASKPRTWSRSQGKRFHERLLHVSLLKTDLLLLGHRLIRHVGRPQLILGLGRVSWYDGGHRMQKPRGSPGFVFCGSHLMPVIRTQCGTRQWIGIVATLGMVLLNTGVLNAGPPRIGFLAVESALDEMGPHNQAAWRTAARLGEATLLLRQKDGSFADSSGNARNMSDFDVLWYHQGDAIERNLMYQGRSLAEIQQFAASGGGLLLSGGALAMVAQLGLETQIRPQRHELDNWRDPAGMVPVEKAHPAFRGLEGDAGLVWLSRGGCRAVADFYWGGPAEGMILAKTPSGPENPLVEYVLGARTCDRLWLALARLRRLREPVSRQSHPLDLKSAELPGRPTDVASLRDSIGVSSRRVAGRAGGLPTAVAGAANGHRRSVGGVSGSLRKW